MGYFSNHSEWMWYVTDWCIRCIHYPDCAVMEAHFIYQNQNEFRGLLDTLIPFQHFHPIDSAGFLDGETGHEYKSGNRQCRLFHEGARAELRRMQKCLAEAVARARDARKEG